MNGQLSREAPTWKSFFRSKFLLTGLIVASVTAIVIFAFRTKEETLRNDRSRESALAPVLPPERTKSSGAPTRANTLHPLSYSEVNRLVVRSNHSPNALLAAFEVTQDISFLREAQNRYPEDKLITMASALFEESAELRLDWLVKWRVADPDNGLPKLLLAAEDLASGKVSEALATLSTAISSDFDSYNRIRENAIVDMMIDTHGFEFDSYISTVSNREMAVIGEQAEKLLNYLIDSSAKDESATGDATDPVTLAIGIADRIGKWDIPNSESRFSSIAIELAVLEKLDPEIPYGENGKNVHDRLLELEQMGRQWELLQNVKSQIPTALDEDEREQFMHRLRSSGETAALEWAQSRID